MPCVSTRPSRRVLTLLAFVMVILPLLGSPSPSARVPSIIDSRGQRLASIFANLEGHSILERGRDARGSLRCAPAGEKGGTLLLASGRGSAPRDFNYLQISECRGKYVDFMTFCCGIDCLRSQAFVTGCDFTSGDMPTECCGGKCRCDVPCQNCF